VRFKGGVLDENLCVIDLVGLTIAGIFALLWFVMPSFSTQFEPPKIIQVKAYLDNRCTVTNDAFVAEAPEQGRTAKIS